MIVMKLGDLLEHVLTKKDPEFRQKNRARSASTTGETVLFLLLKFPLGLCSNPLGPYGCILGFWGFFTGFRGFLWLFRGF